MFAFNKKKLEYLRSIWGKQIDKYRNFDMIASYHNLIKSQNNENFVDNKTWNDLEFDTIFSKMDRNISGIGQQYLYHLLHKYENDEGSLKKKFKLITNLKDNRELREEIQLKLLNLTGTTSYFTAYLLLSKSIPSTKYYPLFYICSALSVVSLLLISVNGIFLFAAMGVFLINIILNKIFSKKIYEYFTGFSSLNSLISAAISMSKIKSEQKIDEIEFIKQKKGLLISLRKKLGYLVMDKESLNEFMLLAIEYLNMILLLDIISYYRSVNTLLKYQKEIHEVYECVANLDASISIASYLEEVPSFCNPSFNDQENIGFKNLYHPLINNAVPNSLEDLQSSILITGSNMSGKTTFIKTVGINFILSQTLYFSLADEMNIPKLKVKSSIHRNEDLEEGKSYFFVEIEALNNFIKLSEEKIKYLFIIDEIFRGTNTVERLAASTAVLKYLNKGNKVFVTTHDVELQERLRE